MRSAPPKRAARTRRLRTGAEEVPLVLLKRAQNLTGQQRIRLRDLLRYNLKTVRAYLLKEDFQQFWNYESRPGPASSSTNGADRPCARGSNP